MLQFLIKKLQKKKIILNVLERIEDGEIDQHEGSYEVGKLLKSLYVDTALRKAKKLDNPQDKPLKETGKNISWHEWKRMDL